MYIQDIELQSQLLKALAHPRRLQIIHLLRSQELCVSDIRTRLDLPQANVSQHLIILRKAGILTTKREGKQIVYKLAKSKMAELSDMLRTDKQSNVD